MCGRFAITLPTDAMAQLFGARPANDLPEAPDFNVCPTVPVSVVRSGETGRQLVAMRWGFVPQWYGTPTDGPLLINARAETIAEKPAFRAACRARRCLIPTAGFYEWERHDKVKLPWFIARADEAPLVMAGIWQDWERDGDRLTTCAIVTVGATGPMAEIHDRMPVILSEGDWPLWLGEAGHGAARLMRPAPEEALAMWRVDPAVNSNRATGPELMRPV